MTRAECLDAAAQCVLKDRQNQYGGPENNFERIAQMWNGYLGINGIKPWDVAAMMGMLKMARARFNPKYADNWVDLAGYAACGIECATVQEEFDKALDKHQQEIFDRMFNKAGGNHPEIPDSSPEFKCGDRVQANVGANGKWEDMVYYCKDFAGNHLVGVENAVSSGDILFVADAVRPAPKAEGCEEPEFKRGDKVQFRDEIPSTSEQHWFEGVYVERLSTGGHAVKFGPHGHVIHCSDKEIRRVPKAEGCEELVHDEAEECRDCDGFQDGSIPEGCEGCMKTLEADAPQTPHDLYKRIIDANPATFHTPSYAEEQLDHHSRLQTHKPTGEELAEMAEEVPDGRH